MNVQTAGDTTVISFREWFEFVDAASRPSKLTADQRSSLTEGERGTAEWYGTATFSEAMKLANRGWSEGAKNISRAGEALFEEMSSLIIQPEIRYRDTPGWTFDVGRVVAGEPDHWIEFQNQITHGAGRTILRLVFNATASAGVATDIIMAKGAMVAAMVMLMEYAGYGVEVVSFIGMSQQNERIFDERGVAVEMYTTVKSADQPVDLMSLAYALAHPATLRRFGLAIAEQLPEKTLHALGIPGSYGSVCEASHQGDIYIPGARAGMSAWTDPAAARKFVRDVLVSQGIVLKEVKA